MQRFAVIGLGRFGNQVATSLAELGAEILAIDSDPDVCEQLKHVAGVHPLCLDATDESALRKSNVAEVDAAVVAVGAHLESSIVVTALLRNIHVERIVARASSALHAQILRDVGATQIYSPEVDMGIRAAQAIFAPDLYERTKLPTGHLLVEVDARESSWGKQLKELDFRGRYELTVIAVKRREPYVDSDGGSAFREDMNMLPGPNDILEKGDVLVVIGTRTRIQDFLDVW